MRRTSVFSRSRPAFTGPLIPAHWWAHLEFTAINIKPPILPKKIEEVRILGAIPRRNASS